jgi:hypothetical protein
VAVRESTDAFRGEKAEEEGEDLWKCDATRKQMLDACICEEKTLWSCNVDVQEQRDHRWLCDVCLAFH